MGVVACQGLPTWVEQVCYVAVSQYLPHQTMAG